MNSEFKFDLTALPPTEQKLGEVRQALQSEARVLSRKLLGLFAGSAALLLGAVVFLAPWSGVRPEVLSIQLAACLYIVFSVVLALVVSHYELTDYREGFGALPFVVGLLVILLVVSAALTPLAILLEYWVTGTAIYSWLAFLGLAASSAFVSFTYSQRLGDSLTAGSNALSGLEPIALDCCPAVLAWREAHLEIAKYQALVAAQGRMLTVGEYCEMSSSVESLKEAAAARDRQSELEKACEKLRFPLSTAAAVPQ